MRLQLELQMRIVTEDDEEVADSYICARTPPLEEFDKFVLELLKSKENLFHHMFLSISEEPPFSSNLYKVKQ